VRGSVRVDVYVSDIMDELDDDDLLEEVRRRKIAIAATDALVDHFLDDLKEVHSLLMGGHAPAALAIINKILYPHPPLCADEAKKIAESRRMNRTYGAA
jgi:hypothetical protein